MSISLPLNIIKLNGAQLALLSALKNRLKINWKLNNDVSSEMMAWSLKIIHINCKPFHVRTGFCLLLCRRKHAYY